MNEHDYQILENYVLFKELGTDAIGVNYRAGEIDTKDRTIRHHCLVTEVYPFLHSTPNAWKKISILLEGVKKSNIPKLYSPDKIIQEGNKKYLVYPFLKSRTLEQMLEDSAQKENPINFDLALSLAFAIADLIDIGSSIVVSGEKSFHGFLTPDNVLIDNDGKIYLKNYGIYPYLSREEEIFTEMVKKYGAWIAPEFLRKEKPVCQSDIYHLGYIIYRILTGKYYSYSPEEDFDSKFSNISFSPHIQSGDKNFLTNIITFFKKTLHPLPSHRFASIKELKDYISNSFHIEELSSVTFSLAYFMNSLYMDIIEEETEAFTEELAYTVPEKEEEIPRSLKEEKAKRDDELVEGILSGLEEEKRSRAKLFVPLIVLIVIIIGVAAFIIINQQKQVQKQREEQIKTAEEVRRSMEQFKSDLASEYQKRLKTIEEKAATTVEEKKAQEDEIKKLREWQKEEMRIALEKQKEKEDQLKKQKEEEQKKLDTEREKQQELEKQKQLEEEQKRIEQEKIKEEFQKAEKAKMEVKVGDLVAITEVTKKPQKLNEKNPTFSTIQRKKYQGTSRTVRAMLLIDETGAVADVKLIGSIPEELKSPIEKALRKWKYAPAEKNNIKVKVWHSVALTVAF
jgi:serine/threonine protein kinase/type II secretory pathway pseudopilin PulG